MSWFRVDDMAAFSAKIVAAGNEGAGAWMRAGAWSSGELTDGFVPRDVALTIAPRRVWDRLRDARAGHEHGLVEEREGGWQIHNFLRRNPSAASVRAERAKTRKRVENWRTNPARNVASNGVTTPVLTPPPSRSHPDPIPDQDPPLVPPQGGKPEQRALPGHDSEPKRAKSERKAPAKAIPADWKPNEGHYQRGSQLGYDRRKVDEEVGRFRDFHTARGSVFASWDAAFRTWLGNVDRFAGRGNGAVSVQQPAKPGQFNWRNPGAYRP